jgi:hypothetical protein
VQMTPVTCVLPALLAPLSWSPPRSSVTQDSHHPRPPRKVHNSKQWPLETTVNTNHNLVFIKILNIYLIIKVLPIFNSPENANILALNTFNYVCSNIQTPLTTI